MKLTTYYINLEKDVSRNNETVKELNKTNLKYRRFKGIDGKMVDIKKLLKKKIIYSFCSTCCTDKMIGCGMSHIFLYRHIKKYDKDKDYALILEDDILVTNPNLNYNKEIKDIIDKYNKKAPTWEIIRLHSMGLNIGSTAAYIINLKYIDKISSTKLYYHIDIQQTFQNNIINLNTLFNTRDNLIKYNNPISNIFLDNQKIGFYLNQHVIKIFETDICSYHIVMLFICVIILILILVNKKVGIKSQSSIFRNPIN